MSLYRKPIQPIEIAPTIEDQDRLSLINPLDYLQLQWWMSYDPHKLEHYIDVALDLERASPEQSALNKPHWQNALSSLYWQSAILSLIEITLILGLYYWFLSNLAPAHKQANLLYVILFVIAQIANRAVLAYLCPIQPNIPIPTYIVISCVPAVLLMEHAIQPHWFSYQLACGAIGGFCGIIVHMICYGLENPFRDSISKADVTIIGAVITLLFGFVLAYKHDSLVIVQGNMSGILAFLWFTWRCDAWLISLASAFIKNPSSTWKGSFQELAEKLPRVSPLPFPWLKAQLSLQCQENWETGLRSAVNLYHWTEHDGSVNHVIRATLLNTENDHIIQRVADLDKESTCNLIHLTPKAKSAKSRGNRSKRGSKKSFKSFWKKRPDAQLPQYQPDVVYEPKPIHLNLPLDTPAHAAIAGFRYLRANRPALAQSAFEKVTESKDAREMVRLAKILCLLDTGQNLSDVKASILTQTPSSPKRKKTWDILQKFHEVARFAWVYRCSHEQEVKAIILQVLKRGASLPEEARSGLAEAEMLQAVAEKWLDQIKSINGEEEKPEMKPISIPFTYAEPLNEGQLLAGRKSQLTQLKKAWQNDQLPLILIYGSRQMGKTSLLHHSVCKQKEIVHIYLRKVKTNTTWVRLLDIISDEVEDALETLPLKYEKLSENPYQKFALYIRTICRSLDPKKLLIVLDEFEYLDDIITEPAKRKELAHYFYGLAQTEPNLHFVFMTTHTLNDIKRSYPRPFSTSLHAVAVGYLTYGDVRQFLRDPAKNFRPYCKGCAIESIMEWTAGQPYLVQLIAYHLIDGYNREVDNDSESVTPLFTRKMIEGILELQDFKLQRTHYFLNVLDEVRQIKVEYVDLLKKVASTPSRITSADIVGLRRLEEHGIIQPIPSKEDEMDLEAGESTYEIRVKLFGRWLRGTDISKYIQ